MVRVRLRFFCRSIVIIVEIFVEWLDDLVFLVWFYEIYVWCYFLMFIGFLLNIRFLNYGGEVIIDWYIDYGFSGILLLGLRFCSLLNEFRV